MQSKKIQQTYFLATPTDSRAVSFLSSVKTYVLQDKFICFTTPVEHAEKERADKRVFGNTSFCSFDADLLI